MDLPVSGVGVVFTLVQDTGPVTSVIVTDTLGLADVCLTAAEPGASGTLESALVRQKLARHASVAETECIDSIVPICRSPSWSESARQEDTFMQLPCLLVLVSDRATIREVK